MKQRGRELRLVISIPSGGIWHAEFGMHLVMLTAHLSQNIPGFQFQQFAVQNKRGSILAQLRQRLIQDAIKGGATHVLFIDSDQTFPQDLVHRMLKWNLPVVAANVATKMIPASPTARAYDGTPAGKIIYTTKEKSGIEQVWRIGTGVMLIDLSIFGKPGMEAPWFPQYWDKTLQDYVGEDWAFCEKLEAAGIPIFIDHDVSKQVGHIGLLTYGHDLVEVPE